MKNSLFIFFLVLFGCKQKDGILGVDFPPPPPPPSFLPPPPPSFFPTRESVLNIQVNPIPHPFNLNGTMPYAIWVNGEPLPMSHELSQGVAKALQLEFKQPKNTAKIHNGEGWLYPIKVKE